jgi:peptide deformylase
MAVLEILQIGNPILRRRSSKITRFDAGLARLADDMVETMHAASGVGLAAPQVGVPVRLIVVEMPDNEDYPHPGERWVICNPQVAKASRETEISQEGCLSVAGYVGMVERPLAVTIKGQDLSGRKMRVKADDFLARAFLHEIDHLNGILYVDLAVEDTIMTVEQYEEMLQEVEEETEPATEPAAPI